jgi:hypothetical protein
MRIHFFSFEYLKELRCKFMLLSNPDKPVPGALLDFRWIGNQRFGMILSVDEKNEHIQVLFGE